MVQSYCSSRYPNKRRWHLRPFFSVSIRFPTLSLDRISQAFIRQYQAVAEYGGWGYRNFSLGHGKALNVTGNQGIQLLFNDGSKLLIGTEKPAEAASVLKEFGYLNPNDFV